MNSRLRLARPESVTPRLVELQAPDLGHTWDERAAWRVAPNEAPTPFGSLREWAARHARAVDRLPLAVVSRVEVEEQWAAFAEGRG
jgi:hypothetical protein